VPIDVTYAPFWRRLVANLTDSLILGSLVPLGLFADGTSRTVAIEVIVMLFNSKRRALHDFIAGTIVVHEAQLVAPLEAQS
jgi:uncharacterized RDD family membrane protein YckC